MEERGVCLAGYGEALKNLIELETSDGNIADAAARLIGLATGGRARVVVFSRNGGAECSGEIEDKAGAEAFARKLCGKFWGPAAWSGLLKHATVAQMGAIGLYAPAFMPLIKDDCVLGAIWCEPPGGTGEDGPFLGKLETLGGIVAASLDNRARFRRVRAHEDMVSNLLDNMDACVCIIDIETDEILFMNSRMRGEYGLTDDVVGEKCWRVLERNKIGRCHFCPAYLLEKNPAEPIVWEKYSDVNGKYYKNTNSIIDWGDGRRVHLQHSVDISAEKAVQRGFVEAKQTAGSAVDAKSDFLSRLSHEIRTPLNTIKGMAHIALHSSDPARVNECIRKIDASSNALISLINDVLDISRIESSKMELAREPFDFGKAVAKASGAVAAEVEGKRQKLRIRMDEGMPRRYIGDGERVAQVMANLLSNAVKFTPDGGSISMEISEKTHINNYSVIEVRVSDTGIGIPHDHIPTLFTAFAQVDGSPTRKYNGTGLGLTIAKSIVNMMHGDIYVESELGKGSIFIFNIELERGENNSRGAPQADMGANEANEREKTGRNLFAGYRALIAEDEEASRDVLIMALEDTKLQIECAKNGREAVDKFAADPNAYDLILMDADMPELDGFEAARIIRGMRSERAEKIPILAMTEDVFGGGAKKALESGMNDHLVKPLDFELLFGKLHRYLVEYHPPGAGSAAARAAAKPSAQQDIPEIEGLADYIDVADALSRVRGNRKIYKTLLQSFVKNSGIPDLKEEINCKRFAIAAKAAHGIKGASANLSLVAVYRSVVLLESQLKMDYCSESDLAGFEADFEKTRQYIEELVKLL